MSADLETLDAARERLSALADGELDAAATDAACGFWREDVAMRASWHEYHLIGDLLRSDDLASTAGRDAAFLGALRLRLADEPVVLAPEPLQAREAEPLLAQVAGGGRRGRWSWRASTAVAAGFVAVAGVVTVLRGPVTPSAGTAMLATNAAVVGGVTRLAPAVSGGQPVTARVSSIDAAATPPEPQVLIANGKLIRDARLDRYLSAHQQFAGSSALGVPSAFLRSATADASNR